MKRLTRDDPESRSLDLVAENIARLKTLFPELVTEGPNGAAVNVDVLKALVGDKSVTDADEKYGLNWHGKRRARQLALTPSSGTLRPCPEESVDWDTTQNLLIEGDNLEVLKLLQKSYAGKVKLIYIDPPYNTGKDFVYPDDFRDNIKNYLELTGQVEGGRKLSSNSEASGRFHTAWLNMMYPRIRLAHNLLRRDGFIFVSIDDGEFQNLLYIMNEVFGEENFLASIVWNRSYSPQMDADDFSKSHDYIIVYRKLSDFHINPEPFEQNTGQFAYVDSETGKPYRRRSVRKEGSNSLRTDAPSGWFALIAPDGSEVWPYKPLRKGDTKRIEGVWRWSKATFEERLANREAEWIETEMDGWQPYAKQLLNETATKPPVTVWSYEEVGHTHSAAEEVATLLGPRIFDTPKPTSLLQKLIRLGTSEKDTHIVMDFFAGSGTTGHAVMLQNAIDGGDRRYIQIQLPEPLDHHSYNTISEITKERLRRAAKKIKDENPMFAGDLGFRVFKLDSSNIQAWEPDRDNLEGSLQMSIEHLKADRTEADILYELLLKLGLDLCVPIETKTFGDKVVHSIGGGVLMACLTETISGRDVEPLAMAIVAWHNVLAPAGDTTCVFRDSAFADDVVKTNMAMILEQHGIANVRSL